MKIIYIYIFIFQCFLSANLIKNGNAQEGTKYWIQKEHSIFSGNKNNSNESMGEYFYGGRLDKTSSYQDINITKRDSSYFYLSAKHGGLYEEDHSEVEVIFLDNNNQILDKQTIGRQAGSIEYGFKEYSIHGTIPNKAAIARVKMHFYRLSGEYNNGYIDDISFSLTQNQPKEQLINSFLLQANKSALNYLSLQNAHKVFNKASKIEFEITFNADYKNNKTAWLLSLANEEEENALLIGLTIDKLGIYIKDELIAFDNNIKELFDNKDHTIKVILEPLKSEFSFYVDNNLKLTKKHKNIKGFDSKKSILILGQDQDKLGGGFHLNDAYYGYYKEVRINIDNKELIFWEMNKINSLNEIPNKISNKYPLKIHGFQSLNQEQKVIKEKVENKTPPKIKILNVYPKIQEQNNFNNSFKGYEKIPLSLDEFINKVIQQNASILMYKLENRIAKHKISKEEGIYNPIFTFSFKTESINNPNDLDTTLIQLQSEYTEETQTFNMGLNGITPIGTQWIFNMSQEEKFTSILRKNKADPEVTTTFDLTLKQPLLKNIGLNTTLLSLNISKENYAIVKNEYKKTLMDMIGYSIQMYWKLYGLQKLYISWQDSLKIAKNQLNDINIKVQKGRLSQADLLEVKSVIIQRKIEFKTVHSKLLQLQTQIFSLLNLNAIENKNKIFVAKDIPSNNEESADIKDSLNKALLYWPEFDLLKRKIKINEMRLKHSQNQAWPEINLVANLNTTGLASDTSESWKISQSSEYQSWYAGLELSIPLGNYKAKENVNIEKLKLLKTEYELDSLHVRLSNEILDKTEKFNNAKLQTYEYTQGLILRKNLLDIKLLQLKYGRISFKDVLLEQEKYISFQRKYLNNLIEMKLSHAILQKATGSLLHKYQLSLENSIPATWNRKTHETN